MPIYQPDPHYFDDAVQSVLEQNYPNFELVISDDADAHELVRRWNDERIVYVKNLKDRKGIFSNLNNAICKSTGEYIQIFCQDDLMQPSFVSRQVMLLESAPGFDMIFSDYVNIGSSDDRASLGERDFFSNENNFVCRYYRRDFFLNKLLQKGCLPGNLSPVMLRRKVVEDIGLFNEDFRYCGDHEYWIRLAQQHQAIYNGTRLLAVRTHAAQASSTLPLAAKIRETIINYSTLLQTNTIRVSRKRQQRFINENVGVPFLYMALKRRFRGKTKSWNEVKLLNKYPFRLASIILFALATLKNKLSIERINENDC